MTGKSKPMDAQWKPIVNSTPSYTLDLLKDFVKRVGPYAVLNLVLFHWQKSDLLADEASVPAMWVCAQLMGYQIGNFLARRRKNA